MGQWFSILLKAVSIQLQVCNSLCPRRGTAQIFDRSQPKGMFRAQTDRLRPTLVGTQICVSSYAVLNQVLLFKLFSGHPKMVFASSYPRISQKWTIWTFVDSQHGFQKL